MSGFFTLMLTAAIELVLLPFAIRERMRAASSIKKQPDARRRAKWPERAR